MLELHEETHRATEIAGGGADYVARDLAAQPAVAALRRRTGRSVRGSSVARTQKEWSVQGRRKVEEDAARRTRASVPETQRSEKQAAKAKITERALERLEVVEKPWEGWELRFQLAAAPRSGDVVMRLHRAVVERERFQLGPVDVEIGWQERVALLGPNGSGKTTLLRALLGRIPLVAGERWIGPGVVVGEMDQARAGFVGGEPLLDGVRRRRPASADPRSPVAAGEVRPRCRARHPAGVTCHRASARVRCWRRLVARGVNCLVLDEPTNHLDLEAIEQLETALDSYDGTLLVVTHDRRLLETVRITRTSS